MVEVWPSIDSRWGAAASDFVADVVQLRTRLEETVYGGKDPSSQTLIGLASVPTERLSELFDTAQQANDEGLRRAVMLTARQRGERGIVNSWIGSDPEREAAYERLNRIPGEDRLEAIAKGYKPPRASSESLAPSPEAQRCALERQRVGQAARRRFFEAGRRWS
jgi:uncharacterized protein YidB (DUF937 family)